MPAVDYNIDAILSRVAALEQKIASGVVVSGRAEKQEPRTERLNEVSSVSAPITEQPKTAEEVKPVRVADDYDYPVPPPEEEMPFDDPYSVPKRVEKKDGKPESAVTSVKAAETANESQTVKPVGNMSAGRIWGTVVRKLRSDRNIVLWVACQDMTASLSGNTLVIAANDEAGYNAVIKEQNLSTLAAAVRSVGNYDVKVVLGKTEEKDDFEEGVAALKRKTGVTNVDIKNGGFGGGNQMQQLMKQAQKMQEQMAKAQEELEEAEIVGESAGGKVKVTVNGKKVVSAISIDPEIVDVDDVEMLEDLLMAALNNAYAEADEMHDEKMGAFGGAGGMF